MNWKKVIKRLREDGGMSQSAIARAVRVTQPYISQLEKGRSDDPPYSVGVALLELEASITKKETAS
jgi:transcriptional regulator with XRE-family HTH domain